MTLVLGTNAGLVTTAPSANPDGGQSTTSDGNAFSLKITPSTNIEISEIGWYCVNATQAANFEVAIYSHDVVNDVPEDILFSNKTNAKGTSSGWKTSSISASLKANTVYWIAFQLDQTATATQTDLESSGGESSIDLAAETALPDPWTNNSTLDNIYAIYALYEASLIKINIGDAWKNVKAIKINIGDAWKTVTGIQINAIGSEWETVF